MQDFIFTTTPHLSGLVLRLTIGFIMLPHGAQKMFGWFGGHGFRNTMTYFTETMKLPWIISFAVIFLEFFGACFVIAGFATRLWITGFIAIMIGAIITTNYRHGLFINWFGTQSGEGFEYHLLVIGIGLALLLSGGGKFSVDTLLMK